MEFFSRVLSGNSRVKERTREAEQINDAFKNNLDDLKSLLLSEYNNDVCTLLDMVYESSFPEEQIFMKAPSQVRLRSKKEMLVRLLIGLDALGVPVMADMLVYIKKHGVEGIAGTLVTLVELLSPLLEEKQAPDFSTDDVLDAMDSEWHSTSGIGSPLLNVIASAASSPRLSAASVGDSPFSSFGAASPFRRVLSDKSMLVSRGHELGAKTGLDKTASTKSSAQPTLTTSVSSQYPSSDQSSHFNEVMLDIPPITLPPVEELPSHPSSQDGSPTQGLQKKHRRKSSSLRQLFAEDAIDELLREGSVGASSKRNSRNSSQRRNSAEFAKLTLNARESPSPFQLRRRASEELPVNDRLSNFEDEHLEVSRRRRNSSQVLFPLDKDPSVWIEDAGGCNVDLSDGNDKAQNPVASTTGNADRNLRHVDDAGMGKLSYFDATNMRDKDPPSAHEATPPLDSGKGLMRVASNGVQGDNDEDIAINTHSFSEHEDSSQSEPHAGYRSIYDADDKEESDPCGVADYDKFDSNISSDSNSSYETTLPPEENRENFVAYGNAPNIDERTPLQEDKQNFSDDSNVPHVDEGTLPPQDNRETFAAHSNVPTLIESACQPLPEIKHKIHADSDAPTFINESVTAHDPLPQNTENLTDFSNGPTIDQNSHPLPDNKENSAHSALTIDEGILPLPGRSMEECVALSTENRPSDESTLPLQLDTKESFSASSDESTPPVLDNMNNEENSAHSALTANEGILPLPGRSMEECAAYSTEIPHSDESTLPLLDTKESFTASSDESTPPSLDNMNNKEISAHSAFTANEGILPLPGRSMEECAAYSTEILPSDESTLPLQDTKESFTASGDESTPPPLDNMNNEKNSAHSALTVNEGILRPLPGRSMEECAAHSTEILPSDESTLPLQEKKESFTASSDECTPPLLHNMNNAENSGHIALTADEGILPLPGSSMDECAAHSTEIPTSDDSSLPLQEKEVSFTASGDENTLSLIHNRNNASARSDETITDERSLPLLDDNTVACSNIDPTIESDSTLPLQNNLENSAAPHSKAASTIDELHRHAAMEAPTDDLLQSKRKNVLQHGTHHQRSRSDSMPFRRPEAMKEEELNSAANLRRRFAERLGLITDSMDSLTMQQAGGGSPDRVMEVVLQETMPWMRMNDDGFKKGKDSEGKQLEKASPSCSGSESSSSTSISSSSSTEREGPHEQEIAAEIEKDDHIGEETSAVSPDNTSEAIGKEEKTLKTDSESPYNHEEDVENAPGLLADHHVQDEREMEENAPGPLANHPVQDERENPSHGGLGFQGILSLLTLPFSSNEPTGPSHEKESNGDLGDDSHITALSDSRQDEHLSGSKDEHGGIPTHSLHPENVDVENSFEALLEEANDKGHHHQGEDESSTNVSEQESSLVSHGEDISDAAFDQRDNAGFDLSTQVLSNLDAALLNDDMLKEKVDMYDVEQTSYHTEPSSVISSIQEEDEVELNEDTDVQSQMPKALELREHEVEFEHESHRLGADYGTPKRTVLPTVSAVTGGNDGIANVQPREDLALSVPSNSHEAHQQQQVDGSPQMEEQLKYSDSQFELLLSELDTTGQKTTLHAAGLVGVGSGTEGRQTSDNPEKELLEHEVAIGPDSLKMQSDVGDLSNVGDLSMENRGIHSDAEDWRLKNENMTSDAEHLMQFDTEETGSDKKSDGRDKHLGTEPLQSDGGDSQLDTESKPSIVGDLRFESETVADLQSDFVDRDGQFIVGGPGPIAALGEYKSQGDFESRNKVDVDLQNETPSPEERLQSCRVVNEANTDNNGMHPQSQGNQVLDNLEEVQEKAPKLDEKNQEEKSPLVAEDVLPEEKFGKPFWEATEVEDVSSAHPLQVDDRNVQKSSAALQTIPSITERGHEDLHMKLSHAFEKALREEDGAGTMGDQGSLHGLPTYVATLNHAEEQGHVLNQPAATPHDVNLDRWEVDTNVGEPKRKRSYVQKLAHGCLTCCRQPHVNS